MAAHDCVGRLYFSHKFTVTPRLIVRRFVQCVVRRFDQLADGWWQDHGTNVFVSAAAVEFTVPFAQCGVRLMPLIPNL